MNYDKINQQDLYLSIGSNLGDREKKIKNSLILLEEQLNEKIIRSPFYESEALGFESDHDFLNICAKTSSNKSPEEILKIVNEIEDQLGRIRDKNNNYIDRIIDIDILFYGKRTIQTKKLKIPHPLFHTRKFVLKPLQDIAPNLTHPSTGKGLGELIEACNDTSSVLLYKK